MTVQPVSQNARPRVAPPRPRATSAARAGAPRSAAAPSSATILVEVVVAGSNALEAATRLAGEIRDLVDSAGAESSGAEISAAVGLQIGAGNGPSRAGRPALSSVATLPSQAGRSTWTPGARPAGPPVGPAQAGISGVGPARPGLLSSPVPLPAFVAPAPWVAEPRTAGAPPAERSAARPAVSPTVAAQPSVAVQPSVAAQPPVASAAPLQIYPARRVALLEGQQLLLTRREFDLLLFLAEHAGRVFDRPQLLRLVWGHQVICGERTVDVHVRRLRSKVERTGPVISTVRGVGYRLDAAERIAVVHEGA